DWVAARVADAARAGVFGRRAGRSWFSHALVREVVYRELGPAERRALHASVGTALERAAVSEAASPLMELAHHALEAGGELPRLVDLTVRAAARAAAIAAADQGIAILERALAALEGAAGPP